MSATSLQSTPDTQLQMLWLEVTGLCNESCIHCYNESGPTWRGHASLTESEWLRIIEEAAAEGCQLVKLIGGEPLTVPYLIALIRRARALGMRVEVATNATLVDQGLAQEFASLEVSVAVSLYSHNAFIHDTITRVRGSHARTVKGIRLLKSAGVFVSVGIVTMKNDDTAGVARARDFALQLGVDATGVDRVRSFGRAARGSDAADGGMGELCGQCWRGKLCVTPDGSTYPCIMARSHGVGNIREQDLGSIIASAQLSSVRQQIRVASRDADARCWPAGCAPHSNCWPNGCGPNGR